eukprot:scaffold5668_cov111-Isochrysis_galbana.AAC.14
MGISRAAGSALLYTSPHVASPIRARPSRVQNTVKLVIPPAASTASASASASSARTHSFSALAGLRTSAARLAAATIPYTTFGSALGRAPSYTRLAAWASTMARSSARSRARDMSSQCCATSSLVESNECRCDLSRGSQVKTSSRPQQPLTTPVTSLSHRMSSACSALTAVSTGERASPTRQPSAPCERAHSSGSV